MWEDKQEIIPATWLREAERFLESCACTFLLSMNGTEQKELRKGCSAVCQVEFSKLSIKGMLQKNLC